jgi:hypothetical protein
MIQLNEIKRMQQLAGVLTESQLNEDNVNEELKADALQSVAKEVASKNNMEFKMVDGITAKTNDNIDKAFGPASKERAEALKNKSHLILSKYSETGYYLFMLGNSEAIANAWDGFGDKWETFAPGTPNPVEVYGKLTAGRGIGSATFNPETGEATSKSKQQGYAIATDNDINISTATQFIDGNAKLNNESQIDQKVDEVLKAYRSKNKK